jgi:hypothetical protein
MKYLANIALDFGPTRYEAGEEVKVGKGEEGAAASLMKRGHLARLDDGDETVSPLGTENVRHDEADLRAELESKTIKELRAYAKDEDINLHGADVKDDMIGHILGEAE